MSDRPGRLDALRSPAPAAAAIVLLTALVYIPGLPAGFVGDDFMILHRLRALDGPADVLRFFRGEFFEYYRPLGFVSHAIDYAIGGEDPRVFHATSLLLHVVNALLVLAIGWRLAPRTWAGPVGALLFALHASAHEPVMWISARFDLLATAFGLSAILLLLHGRALLAACAFLLAVLSKESAVALPIAAAAWAVFGLRHSFTAAFRHVAPWLGVLAVYAVARQAFGGISAVGGGGRLPKLLALLVMLGVILLLSGGRWVTAAAWIDTRRRSLAAIALALLAACAIVVTAGLHPIDRLVAEKLAVAGFVASNTLAPVPIHTIAPFYLDAASAWSWIGGLLLLAGIVLAGAALWRPLTDDPRMLFLLGLLLAGLLPISALTEGTRYLYLPLSAVCLLAGMLVASLTPARRRVALVAVVVFAALSGVQASGKVRDWIWAGAMTADGARLVDAALAPSCGEGHVVFLTGPVAIRGVYTNFLYETFEPPRGCQPGTFQVMARVVREDVQVAVRRDGPTRIVMTMVADEGTLVLSRDLRTFDIPLREPPYAPVETPLGRVTVERTGGEYRLTLDLREPHQAIRFFYYSAGRIQPL